MKIRYLIEQLQTMAVREIGFCVGTSWRSVTGSRVPEGMVSARCRLAYVLFTGFAPAYRFHDLLTRAEVDCLPRRHIRLVQITHAGRTIIGVTVIAVVSPDSANPEGFRPAPPHRAQPGYQRFSTMISRQPGGTIRIARMVSLPSASTAMPLRHPTTAPIATIWAWRSCSTSSSANTTRSSGGTARRVAAQSTRQR